MKNQLKTKENPFRKQENRQKIRITSPRSKKSKIQVIKFDQNPKLLSKILSLAEFDHDTQELKKTKSILPSKNRQKALSRQLQLPPNNKKRRKRIKTIKTISTKKLPLPPSIMQRLKQQTKTLKKISKVIPIANDKNNNMMVDSLWNDKYQRSIRKICYKARQQRKGFQEQNLLDSSNEEEDYAKLKYQQIESKLKDKFKGILSLKLDKIRGRKGRRRFTSRNTSDPNIKLSRSPVKGSMSQRLQFGTPKANSRARKALKKIIFDCNASNNPYIIENTPIRYRDQIGKWYHRMFKGKKPEVTLSYQYKGGITITSDKKRSRRMVDIHSIHKRSLKNKEVGAFLKKYSRHSHVEDIPQSKRVALKKLMRGIKVKIESSRRGKLIFADQASI